MLTSKWSGPQAISSEAPPTPPRLPTEVMSCPSSGPVPVLLAWSPGSQSVGAQSPGVARGASSPSAAGAQGGHLGSGLRAPGASPPPGRVAAGGGSSGWPLGVLAAKARVPSAHLAGLNAQMLTECTRTLSRGQCWGTLSQAGCWNTVRPLALWACRLVRGGGKTELGRLWWGSPLSDAFAWHLGAGPEAGGRGYFRGGTEAWWAELCPRPRPEAGGRGYAGARLGPCGRGCAQGWSRRLVGGAVGGRGHAQEVEPEDGGRGWARALAPGRCLSWSPLNPSPFCSSGPSRTGKADVAEGAPRSRGAAHLSREAARARGGVNVLRLCRAVGPRRCPRWCPRFAGAGNEAPRSFLVSTGHTGPTEPGPRLRTSVIEVAGCGVAPPVSGGGVVRALLLCSH